MPARSLRRTFGQVRLWVATSVLCAAALLWVPASWAHAAGTVHDAPAADRPTATPTANAVDMTATAFKSPVEGVTGTAGAPAVQTVEPLATPWVVTPSGMTNTPAPNRTATATPTSSAAIGTSTPTGVSPAATAVPTLALTSPVTPVSSAPTPAVIPLEPAPLDVTIRSASDPTRTVNLGEQIVFTVELKTRQNISTSLFISATIPDGTDYVPDSSVPLQANSPATTTNASSATAMAPGSDATKRTLSWLVQPMGAGQTFVAQYVVRVNRVSASIVASASALNAQTGQAATSNAVVLPTQPTAITLLRFEAHAHPLGIKISWQTGQELDTFGFVLLRSESDDRMSAILITPKLIGAQGSGVGASYEYVDTGVAANQHYAYWLQEVEASGVVHDYGPLSGIAVSQSPQIVIAGPVGAGGVPLPIQVSGVDPNIAQTAQAVIQANTGSPGQIVDQVNQVSVQPIATQAPSAPPEQPAAAPVVVPVLPAEPMATSAPSAPMIEPTSANAIAIATIEPAPVETNEMAAQPVLPSAELSANPEPTSTPSAPTENANANPIAGALPAAPAEAQQVVVPQVNVAAAAPQASEADRTEGRWGPLNWLFTGMLACFGWLIISSFLAVAVGRYLKVGSINE